jgi:very-short-patch-repair endonuclease
MENTLNKWTCKHCNLEFDLSLRKKASHISWCEKNPNRKRREVKKCAKCDKDAKPRSLYCKECGGLQTHTPETKKIQSEKRKAWLKANPEKHVWKRHSKFKSVPCEKLKEFILSKNVKFLPEFTPLIDRSFAVDVAFPEKMVCLEINGNQHYDATGKLKPYYQEKHDLITAAGWKVLEIHYSLCFNTEYISSLLDTIVNLPVLNDFDYDVWESGRSTGSRNRNNSLEENCDSHFHHGPLNKFQYESYIPKDKEKEQKKCKDCDKGINLYSTRCNKCASIHSGASRKLRNETLDAFQYDVYIPINKKKEQKKCIDCDKNISELSTCCKKCASIRINASRKIKLPEKEQLQEMVYNIPLSKLGPQFGMTDVGLKKRCKQMGIIIPNNSYRMKKFIESNECNKTLNGK